MVIRGLKVNWYVTNIDSTQFVTVAVSLETGPINLIGETMAYSASASAADVGTALDLATKYAWAKVPKKYKTV